MRITIVAVSRMKTGPEKMLFDSYLKRLPWRVQIKEVEAKNNLLVPKRIQKEGRSLLAAMPKGAKKVVLDEKGKMVTSDAFAQLLGKWQSQGDSDIAFLIGGADGHANEVSQNANFILSLGAMTWPHLLARVLLAEQLYRAWSILENHPYHRA